MPKFWDTQKESVIDLEQMEILLFLGVPIPRHFTVYFVLNVINLIKRGRQCLPQLKTAHLLLTEYMKRKSLTSV